MQVEISDSQFQSCDCPGSYGGAISIISADPFPLTTNTSFKNCTAKFAGAIGFNPMQASLTTKLFTNLTFCGNSASYRAHDFYAQSPTAMDVNPFSDSITYTHSSPTIYHGSTAQGGWVTSGGGSECCPVSDCVDVVVEDVLDEESSSSSSSHPSSHSTSPSSTTNPSYGTLYVGGHSKASSCGSSLDIYGEDYGPWNSLLYALDSSYITNAVLHSCSWMGSTRVIPPHSTSTPAPSSSIHIEIPKFRSSNRRVSRTGMCLRSRRGCCSAVDLRLFCYRV